MRRECTGLRQRFARSQASHVLATLKGLCRAKALQNGLSPHGKNRTPERTSIDPIRVQLEHFVIEFSRGRRLHGQALEIADIFPGFSKDPRPIIVPDALMSGDYCAGLERLHCVEGSNPFMALLLIGRL